MTTEAEAAEAALKSTASTSLVTMLKARMSSHYLDASVAQYCNFYAGQMSTVEVLPMSLHFLKPLKGGNENNLLHFHIFI